MPSAADPGVGAVAEGVPEGDEEGQEHGGWVRLGVRFERSHDVTGEALQRCGLERRPRSHRFPLDPLSVTVGLCSIAGV